MWALWLGSLVSGLVGSPHCIGMCGGFAAASGGDRLSALAWHGGRISTYALLGMLFGGIGSRLPGSGWVAVMLSAGMLIWFAAGIGGWVPPLHLNIPGLTKFSAYWLRGSGWGSRWMFGMANGLLPCGLTYSALSLPVSSGGAWNGALAMIAFGLGTVPALGLGMVAFQRLMRSGPGVRRLVAVGVVSAGLWAIYERQPTIDGTPACHEVKP